MTNNPVRVRVYDEAGNWDLCEVEIGSCRVIRVIESSPREDTEDRNYAIGYAHACGYKD